MIYTYEKYKGIAEFISNVPLLKKSSQFTMVNKCQGCSSVDEKIIVNDNCFGCLFCAVGNANLKGQVEKLFGNGFIEKADKEAFKGAPVKPAIIQKGLRHPYNSLEKFTATDEKTNIQPWAVGLLHYMCAKPNRISMEVPIFNYDYDRNGRLDICCITEDNMMIMESKTTLDDALADERFIEQHKKYTEVINNLTKKYSYVTLVGGKETDFYPISSPYCTGKIGNKASRFLQMLVENNIQVVSANALWCLCCKYLTQGNEFAWDRFFVEIFKTPKCIGLVSAGQIIIDGGEPQIKSLVF